MALNYPFPIYSSLLLVTEAVFILNKLQSADLEQHFGGFITTLYDFEKQWLISFDWKAIVIRPVTQNFISLRKKRNGTFKMREII